MDSLQLNFNQFPLLLFDLSAEPETVAHSSFFSFLTSMTLDSPVLFCFFLLWPLSSFSSAGSTPPPQTLIGGVCHGSMFVPYKHLHSPLAPLNTKFILPTAYLSFQLCFLTSIPNQLRVHSTNT